MLGRRRRSKVLRQNRESGEQLPVLSGRIAKAALGVVDEIVETSEALDGLIKMGCVEEYTDEKNVVRYRIAAELPPEELAAAGELQYVEVETA